MRKWFSGIAGVVALLILVAASPLNNPSVSSSGLDADGTAYVVESVLGTAATATGTDALSMGDGAVASGNQSISIGNNADATGINSVAIGGNSTDGSSADATGTSSIALGNDSLASNTGSIGIGDSAESSGLRGVAIGTSANASGAEGIAIGAFADATAANCIAIGGNSIDTQSADCTAADAVALGQDIDADDIGEFAFASGIFAAQSDAHTSIFVLRNETTDGTQTELFADQSAGDISVPSDCSSHFRISIIARRTDVDGESAAYFLEGAIDNNAGTTALVGTISKTIVAEDTAAWDVTATADDTNDGINVLVTGEAAKTIRWVARAEITEVCG